MNANLQLSFVTAVALSRYISNGVFPIQCIPGLSRCTGSETDFLMGRISVNKGIFMCVKLEGGGRHIASDRWLQLGGLFCSMATWFELTGKQVRGLRKCVELPTV